MGKIIGLFGILAFTLLVFVGVTPAHAEDGWKIYHLNATILPQSTTINFKIPYHITSGVLDTIKFNYADTDVEASIKNVTGDGEFTISLPRNLIDALSSNRDLDKFIVLTNGKESDYVGYTTDCFRTLSIKYSSESTSEDIVIVGSGIPEMPRKSYVPPVYIAANMTTLNPKEIMTISGCTDLSLNDKQVIINIIDPQGQTYKTISTSPDINGSFSTSVPLEGNVGPNAVYTVNATYAGHTTTGTVTVPEFPFAEIVLVVSIASLVALYRIKILR